MWCLSDTLTCISEYRCLQSSICLSKYYQCDDTLTYATQYRCLQFRICVPKFYLVCNVSRTPLPVYLCTDVCLSSIIYISETLTSVLEYRCLQSSICLFKYYFCEIFCRHPDQCIGIQMFTVRCQNNYYFAEPGSSVRSALLWYSSGHSFAPPVRPHTFVEISHEIISTTIISLPLFQVGQLSVTGKKLCTMYWLSLGISLQKKLWLGSLTAST